MFIEKLQPFIDRHNEISELLSSPDIASDINRMTELSKEQAGLNELVEKAAENDEDLMELFFDKGTFFPLTKASLSLSKESL